MAYRKTKKSEYASMMMCKNENGVYYTRITTLKKVVVNGVVSTRPETFEYEIKKDGRAWESSLIVNGVVQESTLFTRTLNNAQIILFVKHATKAKRESENNLDAAGLL